MGTSRPRAGGLALVVPSRLTLYIILSCVLTWALFAPTSWAWVHSDEPGPLEVSLAGLSALVPSTMAICFARGEGGIRALFRPWRAGAGWFVLALLTPMALQVFAKLIYAACGGTPAHRLYPPDTSATIVALVVFSVGEEFGWRGYAHPRLVRRFGLVRGALVLGVVWALWHAAFLFSPKTDGFDAQACLTMVILPFYSLVIAWLLERTRGSLGVVLAFHAGTHLDSISRIPHEEFRLRLLTIAVIVGAGTLAGWALMNRRSIYT